MLIAHIACGCPVAPPLLDTVETFSWLIEFKNVLYVQSLNRRALKVLVRCKLSYLAARCVEFK